MVIRSDYSNFKMIFFKFCFNLIISCHVLMTPCALAKLNMVKDNTTQLNVVRKT